MPDAKILRWVYIPLACVWVSRRVKRNFKVSRRVKTRKIRRHLTQKIPTCWYPQCTILASGALPNASPRRQVCCVLVEYRL